jgi:bifunctional non-homologous end joining protein LigD
MQEKSISLYSDKGGADKVYNVFLVARGSDFIVNYQNGARGSTLTNGSKTTTPVPYDKAVTIFDTLVKKNDRQFKVRVSDGAAPSPILVAF